MCPVMPWTSLGSFVVEHVNTSLLLLLLCCCCFGGEGKGVNPRNILSCKLSVNVLIILAI